MWYVFFIYKEVGGDYVVIGFKGGVFDYLVWIYNLNVYFDCYVCVGMK